MKSSYKAVASTSLPKEYSEFHLYVPFHEHRSENHFGKSDLSMLSMKKRVVPATFTKYANESIDCGRDVAPLSFDFNHGSHTLEHLILQAKRLNSLQSKVPYNAFAYLEAGLPHYVDYLRGDKPV
jgi:hypothetical protein